MVANSFIRHCRLMNDNCKETTAFTVYIGKARTPSWSVAKEELPRLSFGAHSDIILEQGPHHQPALRNLLMNRIN